MSTFDTHCKKALKIALLVGLLLIAINQGDVLWQSLESQTPLPAITWLKIFLTPCVPFAVSLYSSMTAHR